jgi:hypothetical protein
VGVEVSVQHFHPDDYNLGISVAGSDIDSIGVTGPNITQVWHHSQYTDHWVVNLSVRPSIGDSYTIRVHFSDDTHEDRAYTVNGINDHFGWITSPADGDTVTTTTPTFAWGEVDSITSYVLVVEDEPGSSIWHKTFPADTHSCVYNFDGRATEPLQSGETYGIILHTFDSNGNQASTESSFYVQ